MGSPSIWYFKFLSTRCVPPTYYGETGQSSDCYALTLKLAEFRELPTGENYQLKMCFFDTHYKIFFGRQYSSKMLISNENKIAINETIFFHSPIKEERIVISIEIVEFDSKGEEVVLGWTIIPVFLINQAFTDYSSSISVPVQPKRYQLFTGSAKLLYYTTSLDPATTTLNKLPAVIEGILQSHENLKTALNFIPEFLLISQNEKIPGLKKLEEGVALVRKDLPLLAYPQEADFFSAILDNITVSFGVLPEQIDSLFLNVMNKEHCFKWNKAPDDKTVSKLDVIERRLRLGIHNGFTFVEEPLVLYLTSRDDMESKTHSLRKRSRSLSRLSNFIKTEMGTLQARNSIKLTKLIADPGVAIVFALDYLVGVKQNLDTVTDSHLVTLCWGAWCPFIDTAFTMSDTITVPLIGGPRPNPDEILCFKNLLRLRQKEQDPFNDAKPRIALNFNFAMVGGTDLQALLKIPARPDTYLQMPTERTTSNITPSPKPDFPIRVPTGVLEDVEPVPQKRSTYEQDQIKVRDTNVEYEIANLVPTQIREYQRHQYLPLERERTTIDMEAVPDTYLTKPTPPNRQITTFLNTVAFPQILDRNGSSPTFVDLESSTPIVLETELKDRLEMNEVIIQFMAILNLKNPYITSPSRVARYFFTLQFYRFQIVTTERLIAYPGSEWKSNLPIVLKRIDENNKILEDNGNGFMIKFLIDKYSMNNETDFYNYLNNYSLSIDVWNADSFVHVGTSRIPLKFLCRQGSEAVQANLQCPVVQSSLPSEEIVTALLYLKMANIGHPIHPQIDTFQSKNTSAIVNHRLRRLGEGRFSSLRTRARPLATIHDSALQRFLTAQKLDIHQRKEELFGSDSLERMKKWSDLRNNNTSVVKASLKRFVFQEELEAYKLVRNESKAAKLLKAVFAAITATYSIRTQVGQVEFFEFFLQNSYPQSIKCQIDISDGRIKPVTSTEEWKFFKTVNGLKTPLEKDLFEVEGETLYVRLGAMEALYLPFKFDPFEAGAPLRDEEEGVETKIIFKHSETAEPISILDLTVSIYPCLISAQFRWFSEECSKVSKLISPPNYSKRLATTFCTDASILLQLRNNQNGSQDLYFSVLCHSSPSPLIKSATIFLYGDKFRTSLVAVWKIYINSMQRLYVEGIQAQTTKIPLSLRPPDLTDQLIQFHATSEAVSIIPHQPFVASAAALAQVKGFLVPNFTGKRTILITAVDVNLSQLINLWLMTVTVSPPNIVKTFEIQLPLQMSQVVKKKIVVTNHYSTEKNYRIHTSNANLVSVEKEYNTLKPNESINPTLEFHPIQADADVVVEVLVFVEDADLAQQEEAYSLKITYSQNA